MENAMPRNGTTGVATQPINTRAVDGETIMADKWNSVTDDIYSIVSSPTPITQGGTGATTASAARTALDVYAKSETYTRGEVDGFRTADQNAAKDAGNLTTGTVPDARLQARLRGGCELIADWNAALANGWYMADPTISALNAPTSSAWCFGQVIVHNGDWLEQRVVAFTAEEFGARPTYKRWRIGGTWTAWQRVYETAAEIASIADKPPYVSDEIAIVPGGAITLTHGLGRVPRAVNVYLICKTADGGYAPGDRVLTTNSTIYTGSNPRGVSIILTNTEILGRIGADAQPFLLNHKSTGAGVVPVTASWRLIVEAE